MILYNVTVNIDKDIEQEWLDWMIDKHIPEVLSTGLFEENKVFRLLNEIPDNEGVTYSIQYFAKSMEELNEYQMKYAEELQSRHSEKYKDKYVAFRTYLEQVE
jgi:hypothetical protein